MARFGRTAVVVLFVMLLVGLVLFIVVLLVVVLFIVLFIMMLVVLLLAGWGRLMAMIGTAAETCNRQHRT